MAWEEFQRGTIRGISGDFPFDEMRSAVKRIRRNYLERFGRNPYFAELLYALQATVDADPTAYVEDTNVPSLTRLVEAVGAEATFDHVDPGYYEAGIDEESGDYLIFPQTTAVKPQTRDSVVLRGQMIESGGDTILCRYAILSPSLTEGMAKSLIRQCVLQDLMDYNVADGDLKIRFERTA